jgi:ribonuclease BN (tRNA processing enzyme)
LHLLGSGGYHPSESRQTLCVMVPELGLVLDAGTGFFRVRELVRTSELHIFLSHAHLDHCCGLTYLIDVLWEKPTAVTLHARPVDATTVRTALFSSPLFPPAFAHQTVAIQRETKIGPATVLVREQPHPGGSLGFRVDGPGWSFALCTDTTADETDDDAVRFVRGVDWLLHECHFHDGYRDLAAKTGHSWATAVGRLAAKADVGRLLAVHLNPLEDDAGLKRTLAELRTAFPSSALATDGMTIPLDRASHG